METSHSHGKHNKGQAGWRTVQPRKSKKQVSPSASIAKNGGHGSESSSSQTTASSDTCSSSTLTDQTAGATEEQSLSADVLQSIAANIHPKKWKPVFRDLMSTYDRTPSVDVMVGDIEKDHQNDVVEQKYQALRKWKSVMDEAATWKKLKTVLEKHGCETHHLSSPGAVSKSKQEHTGARPKERPQKPETHAVWDGKELILQKGTNPEIKFQLQGRLCEAKETSDPVRISDAMLVSIINPNHSEHKYEMKLSEVKERFSHKYGKHVSFDDLGVGGITSFVETKSRCLKLEIHDYEGESYIVQDKIEPSEDSSGSESEFGSYETASDMSSVCPSPALYMSQEEDTQNQWTLPRKSPRSKKHRQHAIQTETPETQYFQKISADKLGQLIGRCEGGHLVFRTEEEYDGERGSEAFTKDVVALWNTQRKGQAYIIVGIKAALPPPHDLQGLQCLNRLNEDYQEKFMVKSFSYKPKFLYSEIEYSDKVFFGVVCIANGKGHGDVCIAEDTCFNGEWSQNDIWYRDGNAFTCATRKDQGPIYAWFNKRHSVSSPPKDRMDKAWAEFAEQLDIENCQRRSYCLLVSRCSIDTPNLSALAHFPWVKVWDFDPDSRESGLLAVCEADLQDRLSVRTWKDPPQTSLSKPFTEWLFVRGLRKREGSLVLGKVKEWGKLVGASLTAQCGQMSRICEKQPLTVVVLWYGSSDCLRHLHRALGKIDECPSGITFVVCMQHTPNDEDGRDVIKELCRQQEIPKIIEIPLERLCFGLLSFCCQTQSVVSHKLPGNALIKSRESQWLQQELDVLYVCEFSTEDTSNNGVTFLKGGDLTWQEIDLDVYDAKRTVSSDLSAFLQQRLYKGFSGTVTLFHEPGAGGTTLSRRILWNLHEHFPCVCAISDVIDTSEIYQRLELLYQRTHLPILLLVDGQESRLVRELFEMSQDIHIVILSVQRYIMEIRNKTAQGGKIWLKGTVDSKEAVRFSHVFSQRCSGETKKKLEKMVSEVEEKVSSHYVYEFGLTVYNTEYRGLRSYVSGYLGLQRNEDLSNWQRAVSYLALASYYGHKSIPCQFFSILFGKMESEVVTADDVLTHSGKQFVLEDTRSCTWRITHHAVAKEILEQVLCRQQNYREGNRQLSMMARRNLKELAKEFLTYASKKQQCSKFDPSSSIMRILRGIFIHRDYKDTGQDEHNRRERLSRLICDIPSTNTSMDQLELMEYLVTCFPEDPTCVSHLGRAYMIFTQDYDLAQTHFTKAKDLRLREIKANRDKYMYDRPSGDKTSEDNFESDSILCTIHHNLGILFHERIKELIGGGKLGDDKKYKCTIDETSDIMQEVQKLARIAIDHFTSCRRYISKGMDASYGYIGEIKVRLHVADFVERCYRPDGYYGFLTAEHNYECKGFVESCFYSIEGLLREYEDLMTNTRQEEAEELDSCQNWFSAIFHDAATALKYWQGKEGVDSNRSKIAVYKLKHQERASTRRTPAQVLKNITAEDLNTVIQLYEGIFREAYRRSIRTDISTDLRDWMVAIRNCQQPAIYSIAEKVLPQVEKCYQISQSSASALYYLYVLNTTLALLTQRKMYLAESNRLLEKLKKMCSKINRLRRKYAWEWLGSDKGNGSIRCLVHRSRLGMWDPEKRFWQDEKAHVHLQVCTGVITDCKRPLHGHIGVTTGGLTVGHHNGSLEAVYVPKHSKLFGKNYLNTDVEFYIGFNMEHGIEAYNVLELKKYTCSHCKITVSLSRLIKPSRKVCDRCSHAVRIPADSES